MSVLAKKNVQIQVDFTVVDAAGNLVTGLLDGSFTKELYEENDTLSAITVTIVELGSGSYRAKFTPDNSGVWYLVVKHSTHFPNGKAENILVYDGDLSAVGLGTDSITAAVLAADAANEIADALLDRANGIETSMTLRQALRLILASASGVLSGAATTTVTIKAPDDTTNRIVATVDADGNRSAVTRTP